MGRRTAGDVARLDTPPRETLVALLPCDDNAPAMRTGCEGEKYVYPVAGHVAVADFTIDDAEAVMRKIPVKRSPATRATLPSSFTGSSA